MGTFENDHRTDKSGPSESMQECSAQANVETFLQLDKNLETWDKSLR